MISSRPNLIDRDATPPRERRKASADRLLALAAAPTFATMALLTGIHDENMPGMLCSVAQDASPLVGMIPMYLLMSAFHSGPWLKLISSRRSGAHHIDPEVANSNRSNRSEATQFRRKGLKRA